MRDGAPGSDLRHTVAIVGAGVSGLACAQALSPHVKVKLFDKSRGVGGRLTTRYAGAYEFDHGAQYFTARDPGFQQVVEHAQVEGVLAPWAGQFLYLTDEGVEHDRGGDRWVGTPRMNAFAKWLARDLDIETGMRVSGLSTEGGHVLHFEDGSQRAGFSAVVVAIPVPQALAVLPHDFRHMDTLRTAEMDACFALMVGMEGATDLGFASLRAKGLPFDWIAVNSSKPGRPDGLTTLMIHAEAGWSNAHVEADRDWIAATLRSTAGDLLRHDLLDAPHQTLHRWLYSSVAHPAGEVAFWDKRIGVGTCGDWCPGGRVEGAWQSGTALAAQVLESLAP